jgi:glycosyltransferase involved in cell wall biosynthesis
VGAEGWSACRGALPLTGRARRASAHNPALPPATTSRPVSISIITATLNAERFLRGCVQAVREQVGDGFTVEHVVVDGGSRDATVEIARSSGCVLIKGRDTGVYDALNKGIRVASGEVFVCLGADDAVAPGALKAVADWFNCRRSEWMVGGHRWVSGEGRSIGVMRAPPRWIPREVFASLGWCCISAQASYMTRDFFERLGGFDASYKIMADYKMYAEALDAEPFDRLAQVLAIGCLHGENVSAATSSSLYLSEGARIANAYGPRSRVLRQICRQGLRVWLNGRNPDWFLGKHLFGGHGS